MPLYPYQEDLVREISAEARRVRTMLVQLPTGGGKTVLIPALLKRILSNVQGLSLIHI